MTKLRIDRSLSSPQLRRPENWRYRAACATQDPELFFPLGLPGPGVARIDAAKQVCAGCPVREPCLTWALRTKTEYGVWGGLDEVERQALTRGR